jgi:hypothetical protein
MICFCGLQCQSQLKRLYAEGIKGCDNEFSAYHLLHVSLHSNNKRDLLSSMARSVSQWFFWIVICLICGACISALLLLLFLSDYQLNQSRMRQLSMRLMCDRPLLQAIISFFSDCTKLLPISTLVLWVMIFEVQILLIIYILFAQITREQ